MSTAVMRPEASSRLRSEGAPAVPPSGSRRWEEFRRLLGYVRPYWGTFLLALILMNIVAVLEGALRSLLVPISDGLLASSGVVASAPRAKNLLDFHRYLPLEDERSWYLLAALMILITIGKGAAEFFSNYLMARIGQRAVFDLRCALYDHLLRQSAPFFSRYPTNVLASHLVNDVEKIEMAVSRTLTDALRESFTLIVFLVIVFKLNWKLALLALGLGPLVYQATVYFGRHLRRTGRRVQEGYEQILNVAQETLSGNLVVKAFGTEAWESERFRRAAHAVMRSVLKAARTAALSPPIIELIGIVAASGFILYAQRIIARREMTPGEFFVFLFFLFSITCSCPSRSSTTRSSSSLRDGNAGSGSASGRPCPRAKPALIWPRFRLCACARGSSRRRSCAGPSRSRFAWCSAS